MKRNIPVGLLHYPDELVIYGVYKFFSGSASGAVAGTITDEIVDN